MGLCHAPSANCPGWPLIVHAFWVDIRLSYRSLRIITRRRARLVSRCPIIIECKLLILFPPRSFAPLSPLRFQRPSPSIVWPAASPLAWRPCLECPQSQTQNHSSPAGLDIHATLPSCLLPAHLELPFLFTLSLSSRPPPRCIKPLFVYYLSLLSSFCQPCMA